LIYKPYDGITRMPVCITALCVAAGAEGLGDQARPLRMPPPLGCGRRWTRPGRRGA